MKPNSIESRRLAEREDRRYRDSKSIAVFNGWVLIIGGLLCALIGAAREENGVGIAKRLVFAAVEGLGLSMMGLWMVHYSRTLTRVKWVKMYRHRLNDDVIDQFMQRFGPSHDMNDDVIDRFPHHIDPETRLPENEIGEDISRQL